MSYAALVISFLALAFTTGSFWWLHARQGSLEAGRPRTYAFAKKVRLRLPLAFFNTGAKALIVTDLQLVLTEGHERRAFPWITTRDRLQPDSDDGFAFATPFSVNDRAAKEVIAEFGDELGWAPLPGSQHRMLRQAQLHPKQE